jgi:hypothetical protein
MTDAGYFDEDAREAALDDDVVQEMARRQFGISLVVAFALLAVAGVATVKGIHAAPAEMTAHHRIIHVEAPQTEMAQPSVSATPKG